MLERNTTFTDKVEGKLLFLGNSDLGNCKSCLLVSMIPRLTLNVGMITMITGLATTEGKQRPVWHEPFCSDTIGCLC